MNCDKVNVSLNDYVDGDLRAAKRRKVERHLEGCASCREELARLRTLVARASTLPKSVSPSRDLWPEIEARLDRPAPKTSWLAAAARLGKNGAVHLDAAAQRAWQVFGLQLRPSWIAAAGIAVLLLVSIAGGLFWLQRARASSWEVANLAGAPKIGSQPLQASGKLMVGQWLVTDDSSRARINVGLIGQVELEPNSRIRLVEARLTDHRLALDRGTMHATIWAPPRLFFVETPSALAIDLGCAYTLTVDDRGAGILYVSAGYVALESKRGPDSVVPRGAYCAMEPGTGPGTPYSETATEAFRRSLVDFDFGSAKASALSALLPEARFADTFTLWHLLFRVDAADRARVYDRMVELVPPPDGVSREGVLQGNKQMLDKWADKFGIGESWWRYWVPL